jgi:hypothetical protein
MWSPVILLFATVPTCLRRFVSTDSGRPCSGAIVGLLIAMLRVSKNRLDNFTALHRLIDFYVTAHNEVMPHSAFDGQTPDEMYFGTGDAVAAELASAREAAREERMKANRAAACSVCFGETDSRALLLQRPRTRMP